jgi:hypothetical protein
MEHVALASLVLFSLYMNEIPAASHHKLALYEDDTAIIAEFRKPALLVRYLESHAMQKPHSLF